MATLYCHTSTVYFSQSDYFIYLFFSGSSEVGSCITDSGGWENYMDDEDGGTIADKVTRFVSRFVDRVGTEAGISQEHLKSLYTMIPGEHDYSYLNFCLLQSLIIPSPLPSPYKRGHMHLFLDKCVLLS